MGLLKAFSKHKYVHLPAFDLLLKCAGEQLGAMTASDISQALSAIIRLDMVDRARRGSDGELQGLLENLFEAARAKLVDAYLPPADLTNLCVAAALCAPTEKGAELLVAVALRFTGAAGEVSIALTHPRD